MLTLEEKARLLSRAGTFEALKPHLPAQVAARTGEKEVAEGERVQVYLTATVRLAPEKQAKPVDPERIIGGGLRKQLERFLIRDFARQTDGSWKLDAARRGQQR